MAKVSYKLRSLLEFLNARLSRRITYWVFLSIVGIEIINYSGAFCTTPRAGTVG